MSFIFTKLTKDRYGIRHGDFLEGNVIRVTSKSLRFGDEAVRALGITPERRTFTVAVDQYNQAIQFTHGDDEHDYLMSYTALDNSRALVSTSTGSLMKNLLPGDYREVKPGIYKLIKK